MHMKICLGQVFAFQRIRVTLGALKKSISIFFFSLYLLSTTEARQLLKLPVIFQHYQEHRQENNQLTFLAFLDIHYMHGSPKDNDYDRDMQLPFKTPSDCISTIAFAYVPTSLSISIPKPVLETTGIKYLRTKEAFLPSSYLSRIWQPPRLS